MEAEKPVGVFSSWKYNASLLGSAIIGFNLASLARFFAKEHIPRGEGIMSIVITSGFSWGMVFMIYKICMPIQMKNHVTQLRFAFWILSFFAAEIVGFFIF